MLPDPTNPKRFDLFHDGTEVRRIIYVGDRWIFSENLAGDDERPNLRTGVATWTPIEYPILTEPLVIYEWVVQRHDTEPLVGWGTNKATGLTGKAILINLDGTWEELNGS